MIKRRRYLLACLFFGFVFILFVNNLLYRPVIKISPFIEGNQRAKNITLKFQDFGQTYQLFSSRHPNICSGKQVVILIASAPNHFEVRSLIRQTWANKTAIPKDYIVFFVIGAQDDYDIELDLYVENQKFEDLIRYDALDSYRNLYLKTHAMFEWFQWECQQARYFIKADEDAVLHVKRIDYFALNEFDFISKKFPKSMFCNVEHNHHPFRNPFSKLYVPFSSYWHFTFPNYCQGGAYMTTKLTIDTILENTNLTKIIRLEDVMYTGIIGSQINLNLYATSVFCYNTANSCNSIGIPVKAAVCGISTSNIKYEYESLQAITCFAGTSFINFFVISSILVFQFLINIT